MAATLKGTAVNSYSGVRRITTMSVQAAEKALDAGTCLCSGPCHCDVEPDGTCPNGWPSKLLAVGMI